jgi:hypothetical protein
MNKIITVIVLTSIFPHHISCMKRPAPHLEKQSVKKIKGDEKITSSPFLPIEILRSIVIDSLKDESLIPPKSVQAKIQNICLISREFHQYISRPDIIRIIIGNASMYMSHLRGNFASHITTPAVQNYIEKSQALYNNINILTVEKMNLLIKEGADINYCHFVFTKHNYTLTNLYPPILFKTQNDYVKSKLLLDLGANPTISFLDLKGHFVDQRTHPGALEVMSPLGDAKRQGNTQLVALYSQYLASNK